MKTTRLIKHNEMHLVASRQETITTILEQTMRQVVNHWRKERERTTPMAARQAFAALFTVSTGQIGC